MRFENLDSLRGIAAFMVVLNHFCNVLTGWNDSNWINLYTPLHHLIDGRQAVLLFFVLSGFVLTLPFLGMSKPTYGIYIVRRFCRIYVPYFIMVILAAILWATFAIDFQSIYVGSPDWRYTDMLSYLPSHFAMTGLKESAHLNPPGWSLIFELRISLLIPLLILLVIRYRVYAVIAACVIALIAAKIFIRIDDSESFYTSTTVLGTILLTIYYVQFFVIGIYTAAFMETLVGLIKKLPAIVHIVICLTIFLMPYALLKMMYSVAELYYAGVAVYLILCCVAYSRTNHILGVAPVRWLGRVSYSLYLTHTPILLAVIYGIGGLPSDNSAILILAGVLTLALISAEIFYRAVEAPSAYLGKRIASRLKNR